MARRTSWPLPGMLVKVEDILAILSIPLLAIIPESGEVLRTSNIGAPVAIGCPDSAPAKAYHEAARRLMGDIKANVIEANIRSSVLGRWFGRKAA